MISTRSLLLAGMAAILLMPTQADAGQKRHSGGGGGGGHHSSSEEHSQRKDFVKNVRDGTSTPQNQKQERYIDAAKDRWHHKNGQPNPDIDHEKRQNYLEEARDRADDGLDNDTPVKENRERYLEAARNRAAHRDQQQDGETNQTPSWDMTDQYNN